MNRFLPPFVLLLPVCLLGGACLLVDPIDEGYELGPGGSAGDPGDAGGGFGGSGGPGGAGGVGMGGNTTSTGGGGMGGSVTVSFGYRTGADVLGASADAQVDGNNQAANFGGEISAWSDASGMGRAGLLRFDLSTIPADSTVEEAELSIFSHDNALANTTATIDLYEVREAWEEGTQSGGAGTCNWDDRMAGVPWSTAGVGQPSRGAAVVASYNPAVIDTEYLIMLPFDLVEQWIDDAATNHGLVFVNEDADGTSFATGQHSNKSHRPLLTVTYAPPP
jgi:hypothetical protein